MTMIFVVLSNPSISVRIWFNVCSCSWCPQVYPTPLFFPIASISSMKMMALPTAFAFQKSSLTFAAHIPTSISMNSDHDTEKNGTLDSPATALASKVFPDPGCPYNNTHLGCLAPTLWYLRGFFNITESGFHRLGCIQLPGFDAERESSATAFWHCESEDKNEDNKK